MSRSNTCRRALALGVLIAFLVVAGPPILGQSAGFTPASATPRQVRDLRVNNFILMIPDGMGTAHATLGRWYKFIKTGDNRLVFDDLACGFVRTYWATGLITDSAPAAAAMATGFKTSASMVSVRPTKVTMPGVQALGEGEANTPVATVLEAAKARGFAAGLVVTCEFPHATPAGFSSHYIQRSAMDLLAEQQVYQGMDVVLGGGRKYLDPKSRKDKEDLVRVLQDRGYRYLTDPAELASATESRIWGAFAETSLARDLDRDPAKEPSLEDMTKKALTVLSRNKKGFFLMIEGSQVDWGAHVNDPVGTASEILAFEKAVAAVLAFARRDGHTAVIIAADHSTGGLSIGNPDVGDLPLERFAGAMSKPTATPTKTAAVILADPQPAMDKARLAVASLLGIDDWKPAEIPEFESLLQEKNAKKLEIFLARALSRRAGVGWVFTGHGGEDVGLYGYHPRGPRLSGVVQNSDIALYIEMCLGLDLKGQTADRFVRADAAFGPVGAELTVDVGDSENPVLVATAKGRSLRLPVNKSAALLDGRPVELDGVVVCTSVIGGKSAPEPKYWFVPRRAAALLK
ncbi:MAG: alkaline phosphatase [Candidatus Aminicenantes bacterium]|nr:alkaline phosphatase [Candidatus Aminicenantes bacterium]